MKAVCIKEYLSDDKTFPGTIINEGDIVELIEANFSGAGKFVYVRFGESSDNPRSILFIDWDDPNSPFKNFNEFFKTIQQIRGEKLENLGI